MKIFKNALLIGLLLMAAGANSQTIPKWKLADLEKSILQSDKPMIINFWATFCIPCIKELPYFEAAAKKREKDGVQLVLVNLDTEDAYPKKIKTFTEKYKVKAPVVFLDETNADLFCPVVDKSWSGAIPATLFINNKTGYRHFVEDQLSEEALEKEIQKLIAE